MKTISVIKITDVLNTLNPNTLICVVSNDALYDHLRLTFRTRNIVACESNDVGSNTRKIVLVQHPSQVNKELESSGIAEYIVVSG